MSYTLELPDDTSAPAPAASDSGGGWSLLPPLKDIPAALARQGGLAARYAVEGLMGLPNLIGGAVNRIANDPSALVMAPPGSLRSPIQLGDPAAATSALLTKAGLPEPATGAERVVGDVSRALAGTGGVVGAAQRAGNAAFAAKPLAQAFGAAAAGAGGGGAREAGADPGLQFVASLLAGATPAAAGALPATTGSVVRGARALTAPFTTSGREAIVGNTMARFASDPAAAAANLRGFSQPVPGSLPTSAQAAQDLGLVQLERGLANNSPAFAEQAAANNRARVALLNTVTPSESQLAAMQGQRAGNAAANYDLANTATVQLDPRQLLDLSTRPSFKTAMKTAAQLAAEDGMPVDQQQLNNPRYLHFIKLALDDQIETGATQGIGSAQRRAIVGTRNDFLDMLDQANPAYQHARSQFATQSKAIDAGTTMRDIMQRGQMAAPDIQGNPVLSQAKLKALTSDPERMAALTDNQRDAVGNVMSDLDIASRSAQGKAVGSNTVQNLATQNLLSSVLGSDFAGSPFALSVTRPVRWALSHGPEEAVQELLNKAMLDPAEAARLLALAKTNPNYWSDIMRRGGASLRGSTLGAAFGGQ